MTIKTAEQWGTGLDRNHRSNVRSHRVRTELMPREGATLVRTLCGRTMVVTPGIFGIICSVCTRIASQQEPA